MEVNSKRSYTNYLIISTLILCIGLLVIFLFSKSNILFFVLGTFFEMLLLSKTFTDKILVSNNKIQIVYHKWAFKYVLEFDLKTIKAEIKNTVAIRGYKRKLLNIFSNERLIYTIDSSDGFSEETIEEIEKIIDR
jgi:hypothetical protein